MSKNKSKSQPRPPPSPVKTKAAVTPTLSSKSNLTAKSTAAKSKTTVFVDPRFKFFEANEADQSDDDNDDDDNGDEDEEREVKVKNSSDPRFAAASDFSWARRFKQRNEESASENGEDNSNGKNYDEDDDDDDGGSQNDDIQFYETENEGDDENLKSERNLPPDQQPDVFNISKIIVNKGNNNDTKIIKKPITLESLKSYTDSVNNTGLCYISRLPPFMTPQKLRQLLAQHGSLGRLYAAPEDAKTAYRRKKYRGNKRINYTEAWVEFEDKKVARQTAEFLNLKPMGGKKRDRFYDDLWSIKYLPRFKWHHLTDQISYERAVRDQKLRAEMEQVKRETKEYMKNVERGKMIEAMQAKTKRKREEEKEEVNGASGGGSDLGNKKTILSGLSSDSLQQIEAGRKFRQRKVKINDSEKGGNSNSDAGKSKSTSKAKVLSLL
ncbi:RNA-binding ATPase activator esf2 [Physocladia obscura]|uniref:RNA-binding ATPase activator esf2 n=1 Tax=Physocladia obscura TaxID=109957 RepID=A0AAD5SR97_9FUNG|nr:RNA-binding ATPase activator esf2 [Physocladia obscura]